MIAGARKWTFQIHFHIFDWPLRLLIGNMFLDGGLQRHCFTMDSNSLWILILISIPLQPEEKGQIHSLWFAKLHWQNNFRFTTFTKHVNPQKIGRFVLCTVEISQNFVVFSEYMNFTTHLLNANTKNKKAPLVVKIWTYLPNLNACGVFALLKVSKFQKQIFLFLFKPKNERN